MVGLEMTLLVVGVMLSSLAITEGVTVKSGRGLFLSIVPFLNNFSTKDLARSEGVNCFVVSWFRPDVDGPLSKEAS